MTARSSSVSCALRLATGGNSVAWHPVSASRLVVARHSLLNQFIAALDTASMTIGQPGCRMSAPQSALKRWSRADTIRGATPGWRNWQTHRICGWLVVRRIRVVSLRTARKGQGKGHKIRLGPSEYLAARGPNPAGQVVYLLAVSRLFDIALQMIADGADPNGPGAPPDPDASWQRVSFDEVLQRQRAIDAQWKVEALAQIREMLEAECCGGARRDADGR
jgi:hypothetical protein